MTHLCTRRRVTALPARPARLRRTARSHAATILLAGLLLGGSAPLSAAPPPLRIGVVHVPSPAEIPAARLYTQEGFALDLAAEIGRRLKAEVTLIEVGRDEGAAAVAEQRVDALVLRLAPEDQRYAALDVVPSGYASPQSVAMRTDTDITGWEGLAGRTLCVAAGSAEGRRIAEQIGAALAVQPVPAASLMKVRTGECDAALHDEATLRRLFADPEWKKFSATLPPRNGSELVVVLPRTSAGRSQMIRDAVVQGLDRAFWEPRLAQWAKDVALEVFLDQDAPDCH